jgi:hypothetical protein
LTFESYAAFIFVSDDCHAGRLNSSARDRGVLNSSELLALQDIHEMVRPALWGSAFSFLGQLDMPSALRGLGTGYPRWAWFPRGLVCLFLHAQILGINLTTNKSIESPPHSLPISHSLRDICKWDLLQQRCRMASVLKAWVQPGVLPSAQRRRLKRSRPIRRIDPADDRPMPSANAEACRRRSG